VCCQGQSGAGSIVKMLMCNGSPDQKWTHSKETKNIVNTKTGYCLDVTGVKNGETAKTNPCVPNTPGQIWEFKNYSN
jgi:hypothetical protein